MRSTRSNDSIIANNMQPALNFEQASDTADLSEIGSTPTEQVSNKFPRLLELDGLRGLAALWVVLCHFTTRFHRVYEHNGDIFFFFPHGLLAVHLFFFISGFVISITLERTSRVWDFAVNRFSRLFPAFWCAVAITFTAIKVFGLPGREVDIKTGLVNLSMMHILFRYKSVDGVYWSLQAELCFYFFVGLLFALGLHRRAVPIFTAIVVAATGCSYFRYKPYGGKAWFLTDHLLNFHYAHLFLIGLIAAEVFRAKRVRLVHAIAFAVAVAAMALKYQANVFIIHLGLISLFFTAVFYGSRLLRFPPLLFLGSISYSLYLVHQNLGFILLRALKPYFGANVSVAVALCVIGGVATALWYFVERPTGRWLRRFARPHRPAMPASE